MSSSERLFFESTGSRYGFYREFLASSRLCHSIVIHCVIMSPLLQSRRSPYRICSAAVVALPHRYHCCLCFQRCHFLFGPMMYVILPQIRHHLLQTCKANLTATLSSDYFNNISRRQALQRCSASEKQWLRFEIAKAGGTVNRLSIGGLFAMMHPHHHHHHDFQHHRHRHKHGLCDLFTSYSSVSSLPHYTLETN